MLATLALHAFVCEIQFRSFFGRRLSHLFGRWNKSSVEGLCTRASPAHAQSPIQLNRTIRLCSFLTVFASFCIVFDGLVFDLFRVFGEGELWVGFWPGALWPPTGWQWLEEATPLSRVGLFDGHECRGKAKQQRWHTAADKHYPHRQSQPSPTLFLAGREKLRPCRNHIVGPWSFS